MKILTPGLHAYLDYVTVVIFALAPSLLGLTGIPAALSYALAVIHLLLTLVTAAPLNLTGLVPARIHGAIELAVGLALLVAPWLLSDIFAGPARLFFSVMGVVILIV